MDTAPPPIGCRQPNAVARQPGLQCVDLAGDRHCARAAGWVTCCIGQCEPGKRGLGEPRTNFSFSAGRGRLLTDYESSNLELGARQDISETRVISREEALDEFRTLSGFADVLASLQENPLPDLILVTPVAALDGPAVSALRLELQGNSEVAEAVLDMEWLQRLNSVMELSRRLVLAIGGMLVVGVMLILGNTIRLAIESRRDEIVIVKLVGGSNGFVRRPFLYTGLWYGVGGGALAALLVSRALWFLEEPIGQLAILYESAFQLSGLGVMGA